MNVRRFRSATLGLLLTFGLFGPLGCSDKPKEPVILNVDGKITDVDVRGRKITVEHYNQKHDRMVSNTGEITDETEIFISGAIGKIEDLKPGQHAHGVVRVEDSPDGKIRRLVALRIEVDG